MRTRVRPKDKAPVGGRRGRGRVGLPWNETQEAEPVETPLLDEPRRQLAAEVRTNHAVPAHCARLARADEVCPHAHAGDERQLILTGG